MGKGNWLTKEQEFERHARDIDRSIARNAGKKEEDTSSIEYQMKQNRPKWDLTFEEIYPRFSYWESEWNKNYYSMDSIFRELRDYHDMTGPQEPYKWFQKFWKDGITCKNAWMDHVKPKLGW